MFLTVRNRLVSGSSPERSSMESWLVLVKEMSPPIPPEPVSGFAVPSPSVWDLGKQIVQGIKGGISSILNYCAFSGNLILSKLSRKRDKT